MTLNNNRAPLPCYFKLCVSFHCHKWIQTGVRVRKRLSWVLTSVTLTFDLWPWPFTWTSLLSMVITPENCMTIWWWEHGEKGVTDRRTDKRTDWTSHIAASSQLKISSLAPKWQLPVQPVRAISSTWRIFLFIVAFTQPCLFLITYDVTPGLKLHFGVMIYVGVAPCVVPPFVCIWSVVNIHSKHIS